MTRRLALAAASLTIAFGLFIGGRAVGLAQQRPAPAPAAAGNPIAGSNTNYLYIEELEISPAMAPNEAIAEATRWVTAMRRTGEYKNVRLFIHNTGPAFSLYIHAEPNSWQAIEAGAEKFLAANPDIMAKPLRWGRHSDNLLSEIPVP